MGYQLFTNNAASSLQTAINGTATTITVISGKGSLFPSPVGGQYAYLTLQNVAGTVYEIVKLTARSGDNLTVVRGQEGTTGVPFATGDYIQLRATAAGLSNFAQTNSGNTFLVSQTFNGSTNFNNSISGTTGSFSGALSASSFSGDSTGLTGTATALSIGGTAATASAPAGGGSFITSSNIGSQSVNYANTSGTANALNTGNSYTVANITVNSNTSTNGLYVANGAIGMGGSQQAMKCDNTLYVQNWSTQSGFFSMNSSNGVVGVTYFISDERLKHDIVDTNYDSLSKISSIRFVDFKYNESTGYNPNTVFTSGVLSQNLQSIDPLWVNALPDEEQTLIPNTNTLLANALHAIAQLNAKVVALENQLATKA
jgi:hypothetical protein